MAVINAATECNVNTQSIPVEWEAQHNPGNEAQVSKDDLELLPSNQWAMAT